MKVAIVYDRINKWGGAERVLLTLHEIFPDADLFTSVYDAKNARWAKVFPNIFTSFLQKMPFAESRHEMFAILMPIAFESFNFDGYDLVISVTSEAAKGIITKANTIHVCYCLTPTRYLWSGYEEYFKNPLLKLFSKSFVNHLKKWDRIASRRPDKIISISTEVKNRVKKYYNVESEVVFPPSNHLSNISINLLKDKDYFLVVGRLVPYKKIDLVIRVFNKNKKKLYIIGKGSEERKLKMMAKKNIKFLGEVSDEQLTSYYKNAIALIMPQYEDFGIVSIEAQSLNTPVIAYSKGGSLDTVIDGVSGILFDQQNESSLARAIEKFVKMSFNSRQLSLNAKKFSKEVFKKEFNRAIFKP